MRQPQRPKIERPARPLASRNMGREKPKKAPLKLAPRNRSQSPSAVDDPAKKVNESELVAIMRSQAFDDNDRFNILEARDKLYRAKHMKRTTVLVGTCPDLCPERERYSRSTKNQLRPFEKMEGVINHKATVKEYSRSVVRWA